MSLLRRLQLGKPSGPSGAIIDPHEQAVEVPPLPVGFHPTSHVIEEWLSAAGELLVSLDALDSFRVHLAEIPLACVSSSYYYSFSYYYYVRIDPLLTGFIMEIAQQIRGV